MRHRILLLVDVVAGIAAEVLLLVFAAYPQHLLAVFVAGQAAAIACFVVTGAMRAKANARCQGGRVCKVFFAIAMAGNATGFAPTGYCPVRSLKYCVYCRI